MHILMIEDNFGDVLLLREALADVTTVRFDLTHVSRLSDALQMLEHAPIDSILVDGLKRMNDTLGYDAGSHVLMDAAHILSTIFRETDIISRFGGDEFVILAINAGLDDRAVLKRLQANISDHNRHAQRPYVLSMSVVPFDPHGGSTLEAAITRADQAYLQKQHGQRAHEV